MFSVLKFSLTC